MDLTSKKLLIVLFMLIVSFCLASCSFSRRGLVPVPDLRGLSLEKAKQMARQKGLKVAVIEGGFFPSVPKGFVVTQTPFPNTNVKKDRTIALQISNGPAMVKVPSLIGMGYGNACDLITKLNLFITEVVEDSEPKDPNGKPIKDVIIFTVTKQNPSPGTEIESGSGISVTVYKPGIQIVPNLIDVTLDDARSMIASSGYVVGSIIFKESKNHARGVVIVQEPIPNSPAEQGSLINLVVNEKP